MSLFDSCKQLALYSIYSSSCWRRREIANSMVMPDPFRRPGGNIVHARNMFKWERRVSSTFRRIVWMRLKFCTSHKSTREQRCFKEKGNQCCFTWQNVSQLGFSLYIFGFWPQLLLLAKLLLLCLKVIIHTHKGKKKKNLTPCLECSCLGVSAVGPFGPVLV